MSHCIHVVSSDNWPYVSWCSPCNKSELAVVFTKVYILTNQNWIYIPKYPANVLTGQTWLYPIQQVKKISVPRRIYVPSRQNVLCPIVYSIHRFKIGSLSHHVCVLTIKIGPVLLYLCSTKPNMAACLNRRMLHQIQEASTHQHDNDLLQKSRVAHRLRQDLYSTTRRSGLCLVLVVRGFLWVLRFPPLLIRVMVQTIK